MNNSEQKISSAYYITEYGTVRPADIKEMFVKDGVLMATIIDYDRGETLERSMHELYDTEFIAQSVLLDQKEAV